MGTEKFKTSNVAVCLKAIKDYVDTDLTTLGEKEKVQKKDLAQKAVNHLSILFSPTAMNVLVDKCPSEGLPTID
ncbi:MAG: hypothetical protein QG657_3414 [Acidobacteriota bacterium]|nr:hypothetical protein [Acidobacteriota bacterium]